MIMGVACTALVIAISAEVYSYFMPLTSSRTKAVSFSIAGATYIPAAAGLEPTGKCDKSIGYLHSLCMQGTHTHWRYVVKPP